MKKTKLILALCLSASMGFAQILTNVAGNGTSATSLNGDGGQATAAQLEYPMGVAVDAKGNLFISDASTNAIRKVDAVTKIITTIVGDGSANFSGDGGPASNAQLNNPHNICFDQTGNLYIADFANNRIRKITIDGSGNITPTCTITTVAGDNESYGPPSYSGPHGDGGAATDAGVGHPFSVAVDRFGNIFIADAYYSIRKVDIATGIINTVAGNPTHWSYASSGDGGQAIQANIGDCQGLGFDANGNLYVIDSNDGVRKITANSNHEITTTCIINAFAGVSTTGFSGDGSPAIAAKFNIPRSVVSDSKGNVFIADQGNGRIRMVNTAGIISTVVGGGSSSSNYITSTNGVSPTSVVVSPEQVAVDLCGNLYFADLYGGRATIGKVTYGTAATFSPSITASTLCSGANITATSHYTGIVVPDSYSWQLQSCNSSGVVTSSYNSGVLAGTGDPNNTLYTFANTTNLQCNQYYLITFKVTQNCPVQNTATATKVIYFNCSPSAIVLANNYNVCSGTSAQISVVPTGSIYSYNWTISGNPRSISTAQYLTVTPTANTTYDVTVTNNNTGCKRLASTNIVVSYNVPSFNLSDYTNLSPYANISAQVPNNTPTTNSAGYGNMFILEEINSSGAQIWVENNNPCAWWNYPYPTYFSGIDNSGADYPGTASSPYNVAINTSCTNAGQTFNPGHDHLTNEIYPDGKFRYGNTYRITLGSWNTACPWSQVSQTITLPLTGGRLASGEKPTSLIMIDNNAPDFSYLHTQQDATSIEKIDIDNGVSSINIYPNPSNGSFIVETTETTSQLLQIFDQTGRMVISQSLNSKATINATDLTNGVYNVKITNGSSIANKRIIINK